VTESSVDREFEAPDLIEVMDEAVRYNRYLIDTIATWARGAARVLDFGAGNGRFCGAVHERGVKVSAVEPDLRLREKIAARGVPALESLDAVELESLDGIYTINVLEHIEEDEAILAGFHSRLKPGGRLLVYVPAFPVLFSSNDVRVGHVRRYTRKVLVERVKAAGFEIEAAHYVDSIGFPATLFYRFFGSRDGDLDVRAVRLYDGVVFPVSRWLDRLLGRVLGKNLLLRATRAPAAG
jgi:2-polyprenyl-3-methyl-5-hydroxy-6-metoxy-1,4-benzoquinol methylase